MLALLCEAYEEDEMGGEKDLFKIQARDGADKNGCFPLLKNKPELVNKAKEVFAEIKRKSDR